MASPTGVIPESLMHPQDKADVIRFLQRQPLPGPLKRELLLGWAITVGVRLRQADFRLVDASGVD